MLDLIVTFAPTYFILYYVLILLCVQGLNLPKAAALN